MNQFARSALAAVFTTLALAPLAAAGVVLTRVPDGGLQPQAITDQAGTVHLVYFRGEPKAGDLFYVRRPRGARDFSTAMRINSQAGAAVAVGTIRGPQLTLGKSGRVHVAWNGSGTATGRAGSALLYTRLNDAGTAFEPQRDVMTFTSDLDGGGSVAADAQGHVYVVWHGQADEDSHSEADRAVFVAVSTDEGQTFAREQQANPEPTGTCGCCGMKAFADGQGSLYLLYREARRGVKRTPILVSHDHATTFRSLYTHPWQITTCPMSSAWLGHGAGQTLAAWETAGRVWFAAIDSHSGEVGTPIAPPTATANQKHPVAIRNSHGETLLVWTEGTGWMKGGALAWQAFDAAGKPTDTRGRTGGVPVWSLAAVLAHEDGHFEVIY